MSDELLKCDARCISDAIPKFLGAVNTPSSGRPRCSTVADLEQAARGEYEGIGYGLPDCRP